MLRPLHSKYPDEIAKEFDLEEDTNLDKKFAGICKKYGLLPVKDSDGRGNPPSFTPMITLAIVKPFISLTEMSDLLKELKANGYHPYDEATIAWWGKITLFFSSDTVFDKDYLKRIDDRVAERKKAESNKA